MPLEVQLYVEIFGRLIERDGPGSPDKAEELARVAKMLAQTGTKVWLEEPPKEVKKPG